MPIIGFEPIPCALRVRRSTNMSYIGYNYHIYQKINTHFYTNKHYLKTKKLHTNHITHLKIQIKTLKKK